MHWQSMMPVCASHGEHTVVYEIVTGQKYSGTKLVVCFVFQNELGENQSTNQES